MAFLVGTLGIATTLAVTFAALPAYAVVVLFGYVTLRASEQWLGYELSLIGTKTDENSESPATATDGGVTSERETAAQLVEEHGSEGLRDEALVSALRGEDPR